MAARAPLFMFGCVSLGVFAAACGSDQSKTMDDVFVPASAVSEDSFGPKAPTTSSPHHDSASSGGNNATSGLNDEQKDQIRLALKRGGTNAVTCGTSVPGNKTFGEGDVQVTFDGGTGRVSEVSVGAPFGGSEIEKCIKQSFTSEYSLKFDGPPLTVPYTLKIDKPAGTDPKKPKK
jgi:hypothetical protein